MAVAMGRDLTLAVSVTDAAVYATFLAINAAVVVLPFWHPDLSRPFRSPGAVALMLPALPSQALLLSAGLGAIGLLVYGVQTKRVT